MKNILIITSSLREGSNSDALAAAFAKGAKEAGHGVETISLKGKNIAFCTGCMSCQKTNSCSIKDDALTLTKKMMNADVIVFSSPVYYYSIPGQLKTLLDRANPLYTSDYKFREVFFLCTATEDFAHTPLGAITAIQGWVNCFPKARFCGSLFCGDVSAPKDIESDKGKVALEKAYKMGRAIGGE